MQKNQFVSGLSDGFSVMRAHGFHLMHEGGVDIHQDALALAKIMLADQSTEPTEAAMVLAKTLAESANRAKITDVAALSGRDPSPDTDILDREEQIFNSLQSVVDLMQFSPVQEVREAQASLSFMLDEYMDCRQALLAI